MLLALALFACSSDAPKAPTATVSKVKLVYTAHVGGEIEPCG